MKSRKGAGASRGRAERIGGVEWGGARGRRREGSGAARAAPAIMTMHATTDSGRQRKDARAISLASTDGADASTV